MRVQEWKWRPLCWACKKPILGGVYFQEGLYFPQKDEGKGGKSFVRPSHKKCLAEVRGSER